MQQVHELSQLVRRTSAAAARRCDYYCPLNIAQVRDYTYRSSAKSNAVNGASTWAMSLAGEDAEAAGQRARSYLAGAGGNDGQECGYSARRGPQASFT